MLPALDATASVRPSGVKASALTEAPCLINETSSSPLAVERRLTAPSALAVAKRLPSGARAIGWKERIFFFASVRSTRGGRFHSRTVLSFPPEARVRPSGEKARE